MAKKNKEQRQYLKDLKEKKKVIDERVELLESLQADVNGSKGVPEIKLGGLLDDLGVLNPFTVVKIVPFLLEMYQKEQQEFGQVIANQN